MGILAWALLGRRKKANAAAAELKPSATQAMSATADTAPQQAQTAPATAAVEPATFTKTEPELASTAAAKPADTAYTEQPPEDSVLHRHYDAMHSLASAAETHSDIPPIQTAAAIATPAVAAMASTSALPQDSVLRRHFLAHITREIESELPAKPADSVLKRHYEAMVAHKLQQYLAGLQSV
ncbi:hypothetical protein ACH518_12355 [Methylomonas sp. HW2-6]|uniref:hypothetical protein n=1 Tax=Methylomonas sp. HW2-6 TaxID=3376687 RepID=UPI00404135F9